MRVFGRHALAVHYLPRGFEVFLACISIGIPCIMVQADDKGVDRVRRSLEAVHLVKLFSEEQLNKWIDSVTEVQHVVSGTLPRDVS